MERSDFLDPSYLISHLVSKFRPNDLKSLSFAVDILRSFNIETIEQKVYVFQSRWRDSLDSQAKHAEITLMNQDITRIVQAVNRPTAIFLLLELLRPQKDFTDEKPCLITPKNVVLPKDFLFVLQGIDGENFRWNHSHEKFVTSESLQPSLKQLAKRVSEIGNMTRGINDYLGSIESLIHLSASVIIRDILLNHMKFIASIENLYSHMTPNQLLCHLVSPTIDELKAASFICNTISDIKGGNLYNVLIAISKHGDYKISLIASKMAAKAFEQINFMIKSWMTKGVVDDPHKEFFIRCDTEINQCENWWSDRYSYDINDVPVSIFGNTLLNIFYGGKSLNFLRRWDQPVELEIEEGLELEEFVQRAFVESNKLIVSLFNKDNVFTQTMLDIHNYILIERGDFSTQFINVYQDLTTHKLQMMFHFYAKRLIREIDYQSDGTLGHFTYSAIPPMTAFLDPLKLKAYITVSNFLIRIKRTEDILLAHRTSNKKFQILFYEMLIFIRMIRDFFHIQILQKSLSKMFKEIENDVKFDDFLLAHQKHVINIAKGCWLTESGKHCGDCLLKIQQSIESSLTEIIEFQTCQAEFYALLNEFRGQLMKHQASGREFARPLTKTFHHVFKEI